MMAIPSKISAFTKKVTDLEKRPTTTWQEVQSHIQTPSDELLAKQGEVIDFLTEQYAEPAPTTAAMAIQAYNGFNKHLADYASIINVKSEGALPSPANATVVFKEVFSRIGKKTIIIPDGDFYIDDTVEANDDTTVIFIGRVLEKVVGKNLFYASEKNNIFFINPKIVGDGSGTDYVIGQESIRFDYCDNVKVRDGEFTGIKGRNAVLFFGCTNFRAKGNTIDGYSYGGICAYQGCKRGWVLFNRVLNCSNNTAPNIYPIMLSGYDGSVAGYSQAEDIWCEDNYIDNENPWWEGIDAHGGIRLHVHRNTVKGSYSGIAVLSDTAATYYASDLHIADNICIAPATAAARNIANYGIIVEGLISYTKNVHVHHNAVDGFGKLTTSTTDLGGMKFIGCENLYVADNDILNVKGYGVRFIGSCKNFKVINNTLKTIAAVTNSYGVHFDNTPHEGIIEQNTFDGMEYAFRIPTSSSDGANTIIKERGNVYKNISISNFASFKYLVPEKYSTNPQSAGITAGRLGDFVRNSEPSAGQPLGWACSVSGDGTATGTWIPTANNP